MPLSYQGTYRCPVCRRGQMSALTLMDAFACNFCQTIFTANLSEQSVQLADATHPMVWRWTGQTWRIAHRGDTDLTVMLWIVGLILVCLPAGIVGLSAYLFPPLDGSPGAWLPTTWVTLTFVAHFILVLGLLAEHYQFPFYVMVKIWLRTGRFPGRS